MLALQEGKTHFSKRERNKKEKDNTDKIPVHGILRPQPKSPGSPETLPSPSASLSSNSAGSSMHSSNPKVKNSPSANTESSPKSKQEVMVRPPSVMSPSSNPQLDSKFSNQGKQGGCTSQSQLSPCEPKSSNHTSKTLSGTASSVGLKNGAGNGTKGKGKRERSISVDSFDQRDMGTPSTDSEIKECNSADTIVSQDSQQTSVSVTPSNASAPQSSTPSHGLIPMPDTAAAQKTSSKVVYVFSTEMANKAAEAVIKGQAESIVLFHIQSTSNSKVECTSPSVNAQLSAVRNEPKPQSQLPVPQEQSCSQTTMLQTSPAAPVPISKAIASRYPLSEGSAGVESKVGTAYSPTSTTPLTMEESLQSTSPNNQAASPLPQVNSALPGDTKVELKSSNISQQTSSRNVSGLGDIVGSLSQEQLEHRERSLQTLRDIQRMLFPDEKEFALKENAGQSGGSQRNSGLLDSLQKKPEGPIQSIMAQSQSSSKGPGPRTEGGVSFGPQGHRDMPFSPEDMVPPPLNPQPGQDHLDHMTPEQVAWMKLQQEFYEEKRRKQEQTVVQQHSLQDMMVHQHGPRGMVRGPPPPYQINSGEGWGPGGPGSYSDGISIPHSLPSKGIVLHPNMPGSQISRLPTFVGMMNPDMDVHSVPNITPRPRVSGVGWPEEIPKIPDGRNFPSGQGVFTGPGRGERFPNSRGLPEEIFQQQMSEKQPGMNLEGIRPGIEINRPVPSQRHIEPSGVIFPQMPGDGPLSPSRAEFHKGMPPQLVPGREAELGLSPRNMNMKVDMNLNISMNSSPQLMPQKMKEASAGPEEMVKLRSGNSDMLTSQQKILSSQFAEHPQQEYGISSRPFIPMSQSPGGALRHPREQIGPDQRTNSRLSHMPPLPLSSAGNPNSHSALPPVQRSLGYKHLDNVSAATSQVNSPNVNPLKSPTMHQVQSPMLGSPSGNLKSPQTPSQLAGILTVPAVSAAPLKSPSILGSTAASPVHLKSPSLPLTSPGWTSSPKPPIQSPGIPPTSHKPPLSITSPAIMGNVDSGGPTTPTSSQPASINLSGSLPSSSSYTVPVEPTLSQNPLSIMMSRMSKFAMPSSTPLYHDAIKTVASSDDDSPPARSPNLPSINSMPGTVMNSQNPPRLPGPIAPVSTLSPMGMTQPLSHANQMPSPNAMGPSLPSHGTPIGSEVLPHNPMMVHSSQEPSMVPQVRMAFAQRFPPAPSPPQQVSFPHSGPSGRHGNFPTGIGFPGEGPLNRPNNLPQSSTDPALCKLGGPVGPDSYIMGNNMTSVFTDPDLQEVIRPGASGIPEFDLSRIIPSEKPSQTLQYFPRGEVPGRKQPSGPGPGFSHMSGIMAEQNPKMGLPIPGMGGPGPVVPSDMSITAPSLPGHSPMRLPTFIQQGLIGAHHRMLSPAQTGIPSQPTMMGNPAAVNVMTGKERVPPGLYSHPGPVGSPNMLMSMQGMMGLQQNLMILPQMRPSMRPSMAADVGMGGFSQGPGNPGNMMF